MQRQVTKIKDSYKLSPKSKEKHGALFFSFLPPVALDVAADDSPLPSQNTTLRMRPPARRRAPPPRRVRAWHPQPVVVTPPSPPRLPLCPQPHQRARWPRPRAPRPRRAPRCVPVTALDTLSRGFIVTNPCHAPPLCGRRRTRCLCLCRAGRCGRSMLVVVVVELVVPWLCLPSHPHPRVGACCNVVAKRHCLLCRALSPSRDRRPPHCTKSLTSLPRGHLVV